MKESEVRQIVQDQGTWSFGAKNEIRRLDVGRMKPLETHAMIVCGIRRCGKTTLLRQYLRPWKEEVLQIRFEDYRLAGFTIRDFGHVETLLRESGKRILLLDEVQNVEGWEIYVRQKIEEGTRVFITGSNATLLSQELGTRLTGRHIRYELMPFSFAEFCAYRNVDRTRESLEAYLCTGGFPEYVAAGDTRILNELVDDILVRDIAVRYGLRDVHALKMLCDYLLQNVGNLVSPSRLTSLLGVRSPRTVLDYCGYLGDSYLLYLVPLHAYSRKAQELAPKKVYAADTGLCRVRMAADREDRGHLLENAVYLHLRRSGGEITYFHTQEGECDFIVTASDGTKRAFQVCWSLTPENQEREIRGLELAMKAFSLSEGTLITVGTTDRLYVDCGVISICSAETVIE